MKPDLEAVTRRNYVSGMYPGPKWSERVSHMADDQVTAIYLRFIRDAQSPRPETPEKLEQDMREIQENQDHQIRLF